MIKGESGTACFVRMYKVYLQSHWSLDLELSNRNFSWIDTGTNLSRNLKEILDGAWTPLGTTRTGFKLLDSQEHGRKALRYNQ